jgi:dihydrodipicolinate reductase
LEQQVLVETQENQIKKYSKKIAILKAGNMSLGCKLIDVFN